MGGLKENLRSQLGKDKFDELYALLRKHRSNPHCIEDEVYEDVKKCVGTNKYLLTLVFQLDGIVFREVLAEIA